jgi:hypothetical protein
VKIALTELPSGTVIDDRVVPSYVMAEGFYGLKPVMQSKALAPMASSLTARHIRWEHQFNGTIKSLLMFTDYGTLRPAMVVGTSSGKPRDGGCWPARHGTIVIPFANPSSPYSGTLRIGYLAGTAAAGQDLAVTYGSQILHLTVVPGLNAAYFSVQGSASRITIATSQGPGACIGTVAAGNLKPSPPLLQSVSTSG